MAIIVCNSSYTRLGVLRGVTFSERREELNGENTLDFEAVLNETNKALINTDSVFLVDGQYFIVGTLDKHIGENGEPLVRCGCDHISYLLNQKQYDLEPYSEDNPNGFPTYDAAPANQVFARVLQGTGFTGSCAYTTPIDYSISGSTTRRQMIMDILDAVQGELYCNNTQINIMIRRGTTSVDDKVAIFGKNIQSLDFTFDRRTRPSDETKAYLVTYECSIIEGLDTQVYSVGDNVRLVDHDLGINTVQRVLSISSTPSDESAPRVITLGDILKRTVEDAVKDEIVDGDYTSGGGGDDPGEQGPPGPEGPPGPPGADADPTAAMRSKIQNDDGSRFMQANPDNITIQDGSLTNRYTLDLNNGEEGMVLSASIDPDTMEQKINFQRRKDLSLNRYNISVVTSLPDPSVADMNTLYLLVY